MKPTSLTRIRSLKSTRFICSHCGYRFRIKWYRRLTTRRHGKDQALLTCPVCRTHGLFRREEKTI